MKASNFLFLLSLLLIFSCQGQVSTPSVNAKVNTNEKSIAHIKPKASSIKSRIQLPDGFKRVNSEENSFAAYLQNFSLKPHGSKVYYFNGTEKHTQEYHLAVLDIDTGKRDLQQCADAVMRLRAEYLYQQERYKEIAFHFTNGFLVPYSKWRAGQRIKVEGNTASWYSTNKPSDTYPAFRKYLDMIFTYAGTLSLNKELSSKSLKSMQIGDVFIQGGSPGHAVIVVDLAVHANTGEKIFLMAQSYMPAQDIHIIKKNLDPIYGYWYALSEIKETLDTPEWTFYPKDLKSF